MSSMTGSTMFPSTLISGVLSIVLTLHLCSVHNYTYCYLFRYVVPVSSVHLESVLYILSRFSRLSKNVQKFPFRFLRCMGWLELQMIIL